MKTCKVCGKEINHTEKYCEACEAMTPQERKKARPERFAFILYISDILLIVACVAVAVAPFIFK